MPTEIACPKCGFRGKVPEQFLGKQIKCRSCATTFVARPIAAMPRLEIDELPDDPPLQEIQEPPPRPAPPARPAPAPPPKPAPVAEPEYAEVDIVDDVEAEPVEPAPKPRKKKKAASETGRTALARYQSGMRGMGRALIALSVLVLSCLGLVPFMNRPFEQLLGLFACIGLVGFVHAGLGVFALQLHAWVNYVVLAWYGLSFLVNCGGLAMVLGENPDPNVGTGCCGLIIPAAFIYTAVRNLSAYSDVRSAGLEGDASLDD